MDGSSTAGCWDSAVNAEDWSKLSTPTLSTDSLIDETEVVSSWDQAVCNNNVISISLFIVNCSVYLLWQNTISIFC